MATTKIWPVKGWLGRVVIYVENPEKTERAAFFGDPNIEADKAQGLEDVIDYAMAAEKTVDSEGAEIMRCFVTGINCTPGSARDEMMGTKERHEKEGGIVAYHAYQSFKPGETTPETAHRIGTRLAEQLWGERFQVVVATHLDRGHLHNHFVINSVSFADGNRFRSNKSTYRVMRDTSDALCKEYGLSVIESKRNRRTKHYAEWQAEREGKPTWESVIRSDIDECIERAANEYDFFRNLEALGYEYKLGKDISVRPPGKERFFRLARNLGEDYTIEAINRRIAKRDQSRDVLPVPTQRSPTFTPPKKLPAFARGSIVSLYRHYLYLMGYYERHGNASTNARTHYLLRDDIRKLDEYIADMRLMEREGIEGASDLTAFRISREGEIAALIQERSKIKNALRAEAGHGKPYTTKDNLRYQAINAELRKLRKEAAQATRIAERSKSLAGDIEVIERDEDRKLGRKGRKEERQDGRIRTGGRPSNEDRVHGDRV